MGADDARCGQRTRRRGRRRCRRHRDRTGRRAARALRRDGALLEEPRGCCRPRRYRRRARCEESQGRRGEGRAQDGGGGSLGTQGVARAHARAAQDGHESAVDVRHAVPGRPHQCARRARRLQPEGGDVRGGARDRRRRNEKPLPRQGHDVPQVSRGVRQAVRHQRGRVRGAQGEDAGVRIDLRARPHARHRASRVVDPRQRSLRPARHGHDLDGRDARVRGRSAGAWLARCEGHWCAIRLG